VQARSASSGTRPSAVVLAMCVELRGDHGEPRVGRSELRDARAGLGERLGERVA
jgi:hypothetical protein